MQVRDGVWRVDVEVARDSVTGRRRRVSRTVTGTRHDAEVAAAKLRIADHEHRLQAGTTVARSVEAVMEHYVRAAESGLIELAPRTIVTTRSAIRTMADMTLPDGRRFGSIRLSKLGWQDIEHLYAAMRASGRGTDWTRRCATILTQALEHGRKRGLLDTNPAKDARRPRSRRSKPFAPTTDEIRQVIEHATERDHEVADMVRVLAATGMRKGELLAMLWRDVNWERQEVHLAFAISDGGPGVGVVRKPTKKSDWRDVPLTRGAIAVLDRQRARHDEQSWGHHPDGYVFSAWDSGTEPIRPDTLSDRWIAARGESKITLLHIRHYAATTMLDSGESYRTVADILGNSETTLRHHYDGRTNVGKREAITALELE